MVGEAKARQALSVQTALAKVRRKAGPAPAILSWKRLVPVPGKVNRQPVAGEREVCVMSATDLIRILTDQYDAGFKAGSNNPTN